MSLPDAHHGFDNCEICGSPDTKFAITKLPGSVDISPTGIGQILVAAQRENLPVEDVVGDLTGYRPKGMFDVVVLDRIVHMFKDVKDKAALLSKAAQATADGGYVLVADTPSNQVYIERQFGDRGVWMLVAAKKGRQIFRRVSGAS